MSSPNIIPLFVIFIVLLGKSECDNEEYKCEKKQFVFLDSGKPIGDYCERNVCFAKCCPKGEILNIKKQCSKDSRTFDEIHLPIFKSDIKTKIQLTEKDFNKDYTLVYDPKFLDKNCSVRIEANTTRSNYYTLEDGVLVEEFPNYYKRWYSRREKLEFCTEIFIGKSKQPKYVFHRLDPLISITNNAGTKSLLIVNIGMLISAFFLLLTFAIYCVLPDLRNINGMIHMAYVGGLMCMFVLKAVFFFPKLHGLCYYVVPLYYFFMISNFLWLATMSFNIWWTFRGAILHRKIHRRGEIYKFFVYSLCVYGTVGALTTFATAVDRADLKHFPGFVKPHFDDCLSAVNECILYVFTPIGILIFINTALFVMTIYNIWIVKKGMQKFDAKETRTNQVTVCSFKVYVKLSFMMGISWIIEVAQMSVTLPFWPYIFVNLINSLIGVIIFVLLITEKKTLRMFCRRFNIKHRWVQDSQKPSTAYSGSSRSSKKSSKMETIELDKVEETTMTDLPHSN